MTMPTRRPDAGFTLIEMIVAMIVFMLALRVAHALR